MYSSPGGIRNQVGIAHGHGDGFVPHQCLDAVNVCTSQGQPGGEGVPQRVKDNLVSGVRDVVVKSELSDKLGESMRQGAAFLSAFGWRQNQATRNAARGAVRAGFDSGRYGQAFPEHRFHFGINEDLATGLSALLFPHRDDAVDKVHIRPLKAEYLTKTHAGVESQDDGGMQVWLARSLGGFDQGISLLKAKETLPGVFGLGEDHAFERALPRKDGYALNLGHPGHVESPAQDGHVMQGRRLGSAVLPQKIQKGTDVIASDSGQGQVPQVRNDFFYPAIIVAPSALTALSLRHIMVCEEVGNRHALHTQAANFLGLGVTLGIAFGPESSKALGTGAGFNVILDVREQAVGLLRIPAFRGPAEPFLAVLVADVIADAEVAIRFAVMPSAGVFTIPDAWIGGAVPTRFHCPGIVPEQISVKGVPSKKSKTQQIYIIELSMKRYDSWVALNRLRNQQVGSSSLPAGSRFQGVRTMVLAPFSFSSGSTCWLLWLMGLVWYPTARGF